ncbi:MAG: hypothetical protein HY820_28085 [Acidobacteria bacterium]|nr:hypothetical protein [Acidobacteriota bacterium]
MPRIVLNGSVAQSTDETICCLVKDHSAAIEAASYGSRNGVWKVCGNVIVSVRGRLWN